MPLLGISKNLRWSLVVGMALFGSVAPVQAEDVIKIGDVNSYSTQPEHLGNYKNGMELALDEVNSAGGINGKKLALVTRDDKGTTGDAIRAAEELVQREHVNTLSGAYLSSISLALNDFADHNEIPFLNTMGLSDGMIWQEHNAYGFKLRAGAYMQAAVLAEKAAQLKKKRWALVYQNYEFGQTAAAAFKALLKAAQPDVEIVAEQATPLGKIEPSGVAQAIIAAQPDAIFSTLFSTDLLKFVRAGATQGLFDRREVFAMLAGEPENLLPLKDDVPAGWWVTGYSPQDVKTPEHAAFLNAYRSRFGKDPGISSIAGYTAIKTYAAAFKKANSVDPNDVAKAMIGLKVSMPWGEIEYRPQDNQSTWGTFLGKTAKGQDGPVLVDSVYKQGAQYLPADEMIAEWQKGGK